MNLIIYLKKEHSNKILFTFFLIFLFVGLITYKDYGIHIEEKFHRSNGFYWLNYILNFTEFNDLKNIASIKFNEISGFTLSNIKNWLDYGIIFDVPAAFFEIILNIDEPKNYYQFRHLISFLLFFLSSIFFYKLLLNRFSDFNVSFIGTIFYVLSPRIYGDSFYNNKDILFLSFVTFALYYLFKTIDKLSYKNLIFFSIFSAICTSTRIIGVFLPISFIIIYFISVLAKKDELKFFPKIIFYLLFFIIFLLLHWPYLWTAPIDNFFSLIQSAKAGIIGIKVLFNGEYIRNHFLPYSYIPTWIAISTPVIHLILFMLGYFYITKRFFLRFLAIKEKSIYYDFWRGKNEKKDFFIFFNISMIILFLISMNITLYNAWRLIYFLNIFIIYISTYGFYIIYINLKSDNRKLQFSLIILFLLSLVLLRMITYHPYQGVYFNSFVPNHYKNKFEIDFHGISGVKFLKDILVLEKNKNTISIGVASFLPIQRSLELLDKSESKRIKIIGQEYKYADYIYKNNISEVNKNINNKYDIPNNFIKIDELVVDGALLYEVYKNTEKIK